MADLFPFLIIAEFIFVVGYSLWAGTNHPEMICTDCGTVSEGTDQIRGSGLIELIMWLCFIIPGLIYSLWRNSTKTRVCIICHGKLIHLDTPRGQQLVKQFETRFGWGGASR